MLSYFGLGSNNSEESPILSLSFNQTNTFFAVGTTRGYNIFCVKPFSEKTRYAFTNESLHNSQEPVQDKSTDSNGAPIFKGLGVVEMLFRSNIFAIVGGGKDPAFGTNSKAYIWDDQQKGIVGEIPCNKQIRAVKLHKNKVVIVLDTQIMIYDHNFTLKEQIETAVNPKGICALCPDSDNEVLAFPSMQKGFVRIERKSFDKRRFIEAHEGEISCIAINRTGTRIATASEKGTLIRIWDVETREKLKEVRRGSSQVEMYSIAFSNDSRYLCCTSSSGTLHLFDIHECADGSTLEMDEDGTKTQSNGSPNVQNRTSSLSVLSYVVNSTYLNSEWSFAEYKIPEAGYSVAAFGTESNIVRVVTKMGNFYELKFDLAKGGSPSDVTKVCFLDYLKK